MNHQEAIDLDSKSVFAEQESNARIFAERRNSVLRWLAAFLGIGILLPTVMDLFIENWGEAYSTWYILASMVAAAVGTVKFLKYRCPHCNEMPRAKYWSIGSGEISRNNAAELWPSRCGNCGWYLSEKEIRKAVTSRKRKNASTKQ